MVVVVVVVVVVVAVAAAVGRNWAAQWHLARAVGKRFRGCLYVHCSLICKERRRK